jgi:predicted lipoprotein
MKMLFAFVLAISLWSQTSVANEFDHAGLARQTLERHIRPGYEQLFSAAQKLESTIGAYCGSPPDKQPEEVREAFAEALLAWSRIEHLRFGPIQKKARHARLVFWPDRKGLGRKQVVRALRKLDPNVLSRETLQAKSVALQGFGALEYILFAKGSEQLTKSGPERTHRCGFMQALAANITHISQAIVAQWSDKGDYAAIFLNPGPDNPAYLEAKEVTFEIAKSFIVGLERLRDVRIAGPLGLQRKSQRRKPSAFERSRLSTKVLTANMEGLVAMYEKAGLFERIGAQETGMGRAIQNELTLSLKLLRSISVPMKEAIENPEMEDKLMAVGFPLKNAKGETSRVLAQGAGLALGFNALDGD